MEHPEWGAAYGAWQSVVGHGGAGRGGCPQTRVWAGRELEPCRLSGSRRTGACSRSPGAVRRLAGRTA